jgi:uncharacterized protein YacL (UPF0231 family)
MDYEFRRDMYGRYKAEFSMGHEALGLWLTEELAGNSGLIQNLIEKIVQLQTQKAWDHVQQGHEFTLSMNRDGIEVRSSQLDDMGDVAPEELNHYDQESEACCGLDDFKRLLEEWQRFTAAENAKY